MIHAHQRQRFPPPVADRLGDGDREPSLRHRSRVVARQQPHGARHRQVVAQHRAVVEVLPQRAGLDEPVGRRREVAGGHVGAREIVQRERQLLALAEVPGDRERGLPRLDGAPRVRPATVDVRDEDVPQRAGLGGPVSEPARHDGVPFGEAATALGVEQRRRGRVQERDRRVRGQLHGLVAPRPGLRTHLLVVADRVVVTAGEFERGPTTFVHRSEQRRLRADTSRDVEPDPVVGLGLGVRVQAGRRVGGHHREPQGRLVLARLREVADQRGGDLLQPFGVRGLERLGDAPVHDPALLLQERPVGGLVGQRVAERVRGPGDQRRRADQVAHLELAQIGVQVAVRLRDRPEDLLVERPADDRRDLQRARVPSGRRSNPAVIRLCTVSGSRRR